MCMYVVYVITLNISVMIKLKNHVLIILNIVGMIPLYSFVMFSCRYVDHGLKIYRMDNLEASVPYVLKNFSNVISRPLAFYIMCLV